MATSDPIRLAKHVYLIGNGGSAANACHIANDLVACGIKAHALTADVATLTAAANDFGWYRCFSMQVDALGEPGDLLIALSGSGRSPNVLFALEAAKAKGMATWAVFGAYNDHSKLDVDILTLGGDDMQEAEQHQLAWGHELMKSLRARS